MIGPNASPQQIISSISYPLSHLHHVLHPHYNPIADADLTLFLANRGISLFIQLTYDCLGNNILRN